MTVKRIQVYGLTTKEYDELKAQAENLGLESVSEYAKMVLSQVLSEKKYPMDYFSVSSTVAIEQSVPNMLVEADHAKKPNSSLKLKIMEIKQTSTSLDDESHAHWIKPSLKLSAVEAAFLKEAAEQADMSISSFIRLALRSQLTGSSILNNEEVKALFQSNFQLLRIGRNLNQIAHALNAMQSAEVTTTKIAELEAAINVHVERVQAVIHANQEKLV